MKKNKLAQVVALAGVILIALMVIATLVVGFLNFENRDRVFFTLIFLDIVVPVFLYFFLWLLRRNVKEVRDYSKRVMDAARGESTDEDSENPENDASQSVEKDKEQGN